MCGISLVLAKERVDISSFRAFNSIIKHRGPYDEGFIFVSGDSNDIQIVGGQDTQEDVWNTATNYQPQHNINKIQGDYKIGIGHRRLAILDLSALGHLPMCDALERYWITYNGEIYNFLELRKELQDLGYEFSSQSDTEVILAAYASWGADCLNRFSGMWSFAIYDRQTKTIFISRDRYGIKPLYYWFSPEGDFYLASEIKQFTQIPSWKAALNPQRVYDYLFYAMTDHTDETMFKDVYVVLPGHSISIMNPEIQKTNKGRIKQEKWFNPENIKFSGTFEEAASGFNRHFDQAIDLHLRADVPIGSALSGGLDSTAIVCSVNNKLKEKGVESLQKTFSSCADIEKYNEKKWMDEVIKSTNVEASFIFPKGQDVFALSEEIIWHQDEPYQSQSAFLGYHVFEDAKKHNVKVLLNGQGADEYLSGYNAFSIFRKLNLIKQWKFLQVYKELKYLPTLEKLNEIRLLLYHLLPKKWIRFFSKFSSEHKTLNGMINMNQLGAKNKHPHDKKGFKFRSIFEIANHQLFCEPLQKYLRWEDRNSMAHSIEARVPFLDHNLVAYSTQMPIDYLDGFQESKKLMIYGLEDILPTSIRNRKDKKGFITPEEHWFKHEFFEEFKNMFKKYNAYSGSILNEKAVLDYFNQIIDGKKPFDYTYWRLISLGMWMKVFNIQS